jgi:uncharacterized protein YggT (Ycf19 family)
VEDRILADDESRRLAQHDATTSAVDRDINADIAHRAEQGTRAEAVRLDRVASDMRSHAIDEVAGTGRDLDRSRIFARTSQVLDYLFSLLYGLLAIRLVLALIGARSGNGFVQFIDAVTNPFYGLFHGIVSSPSSGGHTLAVPIIVALIVYALLHGAINGLFRMLIHRKTAI